MSGSGGRRAASLLAVMAFGALSSCEQLAPREVEAWEELRAEGLLEPEPFKSPALAGALNILPGVGNAYLDQWRLFAVNLLTWPISVTWGIPVAIRDAGVINIRETVFYYSFGPGRDLLEARRRESGVPVTASAADAPDDPGDEYQLDGATALEVESAPGLEYFTLGDSRAVVLALQGQPKSIRRYGALEKEVWRYDFASVTFRQGRVYEWTDSSLSPTLKAQIAFPKTLELPKRDYFTEGDVPEMVLAVQGQPASIRRYDALRQDVWGYGFASVTFVNGRVSEWSSAVVGPGLKARVASDVR